MSGQKIIEGLKDAITFAKGDASKGRYVWTGEGPEPARWFAPDGTLVYRSYEDYCDD